MTYFIIALVVLLAVLGIAHFVRRQIATTREQLKHVDRSKLNDLNHDAWEDDDPPTHNREDPP